MGASRDPLRGSLARREAAASHGLPLGPFEHGVFFWACRAPGAGNTRLTGASRATLQVLAAKGRYYAKKPFATSAKANLTRRVCGLCAAPAHALAHSGCGHLAIARAFASVLPVSAGNGDTVYLTAGGQRPAGRSTLQHVFHGQFEIDLSGGSPVRQARSRAERVAAKQTARAPCPVPGVDPR